MPLTLRFYCQANRNEFGRLLPTLRELLINTLYLRRSFALTMVCGGASGDTYHETIECAVYDCSRGKVCVYALNDECCNGHAHLISVLANLPKDSEEFSKLSPWLAKHEFVSHYKYFMPRPIAHPHFRSFLDSLPDLSLAEKAFLA